MAGLLLLFAHPDDESFFVAGTIGRYSTAGVPIALVCATRGERGSTADLCTIEELPRAREAELRDAAGILGIQTVEMLPYEDQKLWSAPIDEIRRSLVAAIRRDRPEIVITFDPNGGNRHTDHTSISQFASDALAAAADLRWYRNRSCPPRPPSAVASAHPAIRTGRHGRRRETARRGYSHRHCAFSRQKT